MCGSGVCVTCCLLFVWGGVKWLCGNLVTLCDECAVLCQRTFGVLDFYRNSPICCWVACRGQCVRLLVVWTL